VTFAPPEASPGGEVPVVPIVPPRD
jgi:hypothetical protein